MGQLSISLGRLDRIAIGLSGLCLVHCLATAVFLGILSAAGGFPGPLSCLPDTTSNLTTP